MIELITALVVAIAGPNVSVTCGATPPATHPNAVGWVYPGRREVFLTSRICAGITLDPRTSVSKEFSLSLLVILHEAWHVAGVRDEGCANLKATLVGYDILRRFWKIPFFSAHSWLIGGEMNQHTRRQAPAYFPFPWACDR